MNNKGADQSAWMCRLVCTFVVRKPPEDRFSRVEAQRLGALDTITQKLYTVDTNIVGKRKFWWEICREDSNGSLLECLAWDWGVSGSSLTSGTLLCPEWARHFIFTAQYYFNPGNYPNMSERCWLWHKAQSQTKRAAVKRMPQDIQPHCKASFKQFPYFISCVVLCSRSQWDLSWSPCFRPDFFICWFIGIFFRFRVKGTEKKALKMTSLLVIF